MSLPFFYRFDPWLVALILAAIFFGVAEIGYLVGRKYGSGHDDASQLLSSIQNAIFALLALLLAFTFAAASSRYDARRVQVVNEANAMGTAYLRTRTLPEPYKTRAGNLIRRYADVQLTYFYIGDIEELGDLVRQTNELQNQLWAVTTDVAVENRDSIVVGLYEASVNDVIDNQTKRLAVFLNNVPESIWRILTLIALVAFFIIGYTNGSRGRRSMLVRVMVAVMVALVIVMIVDLDRSLTGMTRVSPQPLIDLRTSLRQ